MLLGVAILSLKPRGFGFRAYKGLPLYKTHCLLLLHDPIHTRSSRYVNLRTGGAQGFMWLRREGLGLRVEGLGLRDFDP